MLWRKRWEPWWERYWSLMTELEAGGQFGGGVGPETLELLDEEEAAEYFEAGIAKDAGVAAGVVEQELRLDAVDVGRIEQRFKEMREQGLLDLKGGLRRIGVGSCAGRRWRTGKSEDIADDGLGFFVDAEGVTGHLP